MKIRKGKIKDNKKLDPLNNNEDVLKIVYKIRDDLIYEVDDNGSVTIIKLRNHAIQRGLRKLKVRIPESTKITLDDYASYAFININGVNTVKDIGTLMENKFGDAAKPVYERLLLFLNHINVNARYIEIIK